jgi:hypothetical protein
MNQSDFVYDSVYQRAIKRGVSESIAVDHANNAVELYGKNQFKKVVTMIEEQIAHAVKTHKMLNDKRRCEVISVIIGERVTRFWCGEKYVFERVAPYQWKCISGQSYIPQTVVDSLGE